MLMENIKLALSSLKSNKLRSFLTMLGIIIGIASVIAITTIGNSTVQQTRKEYSEFGTNVINFYIFKSDTGDDVQSTASDQKVEFTEDMMKKMVSKYGNQIEQIVLQNSLTSTKATASGNGKASANVDISGVNNGFLSLPTNNITFLSGGKFARDQMNADSQYCIVSSNLVDNLFNGDYEGAIGQQIDVALSDADLGGTDDASNTYTYTICGVYQYQMNASDVGNATDMKDVMTSMYIPYLNAQSLLKYEDGKTVNSFSLNMKTGTDVFTMTDEIQAYLKSLLPKDSTAEIYADNNATYIKQAEQSVKQKNLQTTLVGAIALLVGGIGVMNIMTVSIVERTREIGTRKALGALNKDIRMQFITEAVIICLLGGLIGVAGGIAIGAAACHIQHIETVFSFWQILAAFAVSSAIGIFFGYYPANKAAKMDPIDALRYE